MEKTTATGYQPAPVEIPVIAAPLPTQMLAVNASQHKQVPQDWGQTGLWFTDPSFIAWGPVSPNSSIKQAVCTAWGKIQAEWARARAAGLTPNSLLIGGYAPLVIPVASYALAQSLPPAVVVAVMGPAPTVDGERRKFILQGWRALPPQGVVVREGDPLPQKPSYNWGGIVHVSSRPLASEREAELERHMTSKLTTPCAPVLPPAPGVDISQFEEDCRSIVEAAMEKSCGQILLDGAPAETAIRVSLLARSAGVQVSFVRTGPPPASGPKIPQIVGIEKMITY